MAPWRERDRERVCGSGVFLCHQTREEAHRGLQTADTNQVACPANWRPGEDVIVPAPATTEGARERAASKQFQVTEWYLAKKPLGGGAPPKSRGS